MAELSADQIKELDIPGLLRQLGVFDPCFEKLATHEARQYPWGPHKEAGWRRPKCRREPPHELPRCECHVPEDDWMVPFSDWLLVAKKAAGISKRYSQALHEAAYRKRVRLFFGDDEKEAARFIKGASPSPVRPEFEW